MDIVLKQPGRDAGHPAHELARDLLPGPGDLRRPDAGPQQRLPRPRAGDGPRHRRRLHERPRLGARLRDQRRDDRLVLLRDARHRATRSSSSAPVAGCPQALPPYQQLHHAPTTPAPPARRSTAAQTARFQGHPVRNAIWLRPRLRVAGRRATRRSPARPSPGATLKITKDFNLYTAPVQIGNTVGGADAGRPSTPPQAIPTHLESSLTVPAYGTFKWDVNPSVRPSPAY